MSGNDDAALAAAADAASDAGDGGTGDAATDSAAELATLRDGLAAQGKRLDQVLGYLEGLSAGGPRQAPDETADDDIAALPDDIETRPLKDTLALVETRISKQIERNVVRPLHDTIKGLNAQLQSAKAETQIAQLQGKHKDFAEWGPEIADYVKQNPHAASKLDSVYRIVRADNAEKAKRLDTKYQPAGEGGDGQPPKRGTTQLKPGGPVKPGASKRLGLAEAADTAWNEQGGALDDLLRSMNGG